MTSTPCPRPTAVPSPAGRALGVLAALFLAACGGGGGGDTAPPPPPPMTEVPASAANDDASWEAFAIAQAATETGEPLQLDLVATVPSSETEEPIALQ